MQSNQQIPHANRSYTLSGEPALFADRRFTAHEYLEDFDLYNMNVRLFYPVLGWIIRSAWAQARIPILTGRLQMQQLLWQPIRYCRYKRGSVRM